MDKAAVEAYAAEHVTPHLGKPLVGHAKLAAAVAWDEGLDVSYSEPPPDHANIQNFAAAREKMMEQAQALARASTFQLA
jgi:hypothetical protein